MSSSKGKDVTKLMLAPLVLKLVTDGMTEPLLRLKDGEIRSLVRIAA